MVLPNSKKNRSDPDSKNLEDPDKDKILSTKDEDMEDGEIIEELEEGKILETQEPEKALSSGIISNQVQDEQEKKQLSWYLEKEIKENKERATPDPKKWSELVKKTLPPSREYEEYKKNQGTEAKNIALSPDPEFWKTEYETAENKSSM
ncbi:hypothetical protein O181_103553 [Austropuccinia psidii MF-1]|uniref:Uncharacterized protein n=1 Tax=Austropuccinia psidii MF-1 TaxID=1389203 RepID=A0A9Q3PJ54_9BASI|nr:hypothetical protein [Austropuccinia psidii MF-1]